MTSTKLISSLERIINNIRIEDFPYVEQNNIYIKNIIITKDSDQFVIKTIDNQIVAITNFKESAIAIARCKILKRPVITKILKLDQEMNKHFTDIKMFKHALKTSRDLDTRLTRHARIDVSKAMYNNARKKVKSFIFNN